MQRHWCSQLHISLGGVHGPKQEAMRVGHCTGIKTWKTNSFFYNLSFNT